MSGKLTVAGRALLVAAVMLAVGSVSTSPARADYLGYAILKGDTMQKGDWLSRVITSEGYTVQLIMQPDGNLVLKRTNGHICWAAGSNPSGHRATYQGDGNFVVYNTSNRGVWSSNTVGVSGSSVSIESNGDLWVGNRRIALC
ncbi:hypothetical protein [Streptosporangium sp. NBC_01469]|uniref:hypothetical protein n=1 Tax=Streptosporangium sp. NBC_01469 TaxID=2903898 RepID=UPI002E2A033F|nr:hypothetical protein [Streptosporangium sp. NBC_01469]